MRAGRWAVAEASRNSQPECCVRARRSPSRRVATTQAMRVLCAVLALDGLSSAFAQDSAPSQAHHQRASEGGIPPAKRTYNGRVRLRITTNLTEAQSDRSWTLHLRNAPPPARFAALCLLPCETQLTPGTYHFGLAENAQPVEALSPAMEVQTASHLRIGFRPPSALHTAARAVLLLAALAFIPSPALWGSAQGQRARRAGMVSTFVSGGLLIVSTIAFLRSDSGGTQLTLHPLASAPP